MTDGTSWAVTDASWPLIVNRTLGKQVSDEQLKASLAAMDEIVERRSGSFSIVHDYTGFQNLTATQRRIVADYGKRNKARTEARCVGIAFVFDSALLRGLLTAIHWIHPSKIHTKIFANAVDAKKWAVSLHRPSAFTSSAPGKTGDSVRPPLDHVS